MPFLRGRVRLVWAGLVAATFLAISVAGCGTAGQSSKTAAKGSISAADQAAAKRGNILIGFPIPFTGPLASNSTSAKWGIDQAVAAVNKNGGIYLKSLGKKLPIKVVMLDTQSSPTKTSETAAELITKDHVDILAAEPSPLAVNPVTGIAERYKVPFVGLIDPVDGWLQTGEHKWCYDVFYTNKEAAQALIDLVKANPGMTNNVFGLLLPNDSDGVTRSAFFDKELPALGFKVVDPGRFPNDTNDFSSMISRFKAAHVQIVTGVVLLPTFATFWRQAHEDGFAPKIVEIAEALNVPSQPVALGDDLADGVATEMFWYPTDKYKSSFSGETATQLADAWTKETGNEFDQNLGYFYGGIEICADAIKAAGSVDPNKINEALSTGTFDTIIGTIKFNSQHYDLAPVAIGQWVKGPKGSKWPYVMQIVNNQLAPKIPTTASLIPIPAH